MNITTKTSLVGFLLALSTLTSPAPVPATTPEKNTLEERLTRLTAALRKRESQLNNSSEPREGQIARGWADGSGRDWVNGRGRAWADGQSRDWANTRMGGWGDINQAWCDCFKRHDIHVGVSSDGPAFYTISIVKLALKKVVLKRL